MRILVALDASPTSLHAARTAARFFAAADTEVVVINVAQVPAAWIYPAGFGAVAPLQPLDWETLTGLSTSEVAGLAEQAGLDHPEVLAGVGDPASRICAAAEDHDVDVIVVGSHDRGLLSRLLDPSVATGVVRGTHRPVLVVSDGPPDDQKG
ncbi:MAG: universal stress protein [Acidimicrobiales bacterium]